MASLAKRSKSAPASSGEHEFPALFTIEGSNRHELILVNPGHDLDELKQSMEALTTSSPNCAEFMSKYKSKDSKETIKEVKVKWGGKDKQLFPKETLVTDENCEAVLRMMAIGVGQDVFDVKVQHVETEQGAAKKEGAAKK